MKDGYYEFWKNRTEHSAKLESIYFQESYLSIIIILNTGKL